MCAKIMSHGLPVPIGSGYGIDCVATVGSEGNALVIADIDYTSYTCEIRVSDNIPNSVGVKCTYPDHDYDATPE